jgi:hypothetical protein
MATILKGAAAFFYDNAGYSWDDTRETPEQGKVRTAEKLAAAERFALDQDWYFEWDIDKDAHLDRPSGIIQPEDKAYYCELWDSAGDNLLQCLCGIWEPTREYRRVVQAELALEAKLNQEAKEEVKK